MRTAYRNRCRACPRDRRVSRSTSNDHARPYASQSLDDTRRVFRTMRRTRILVQSSLGALWRYLTRKSPRASGTPMRTRASLSPSASTQRSDATSVLTDAGDAARRTSQNVGSSRTATTQVRADARRARRRADRQGRRRGAATRARSRAVSRACGPRASSAISARRRRTRPPTNRATEPAAVRRGRGVLRPRAAPQRANCQQRYPCQALLAALEDEAHPRVPTGASMPHAALLDAVRHFDRPPDRSLQRLFDREHEHCSSDRPRAGSTSVPTNAPSACASAARGSGSAHEHARPDSTRACERRREQDEHTCRERSHTSPTSHGIEHGHSGSLAASRA